ncbi:MAG TPA: hypothetical protein VNX26_09355 [Candidatus Acidoferrum sp.]|jgi:hypothetical protein|nr:hypothetical protein [Candidatus Acidoferrum sp.]
MPLIREQLKSDPVMARLATHSTVDFRPIVASGFIAAVILAVFIAIFAHGIPVLVAAAVGIYVAAIGVYRLRNERRLLSDYSTAVATVSQRTKTEGPEGGFSYSVRYGFLAPDGKLYLGESGSTEKELPLEGETIPILYRRTDPSQNMTLATFVFHRFTYTGTE